MDVLILEDDEIKYSLVVIIYFRGLGSQINTKKHEQVGLGWPQGHRE